MQEGAVERYASECVEMADWRFDARRRMNGTETERHLRKRREEKKIKGHDEML